MQRGLTLSPFRLTLAAFSFSLPLTGFSLIQSEGLVRAFAPSLFLSLPFLGLHLLKPDVWRSPEVRRAAVPILILCASGLVSIGLNSLAPAQVLVHTPDMAIQEPNTGLPLLERYFRLVFTFVVVAVLAAATFKDEQGFQTFCRSFVAGYSLGALFGLGQFMADLAGLPFWTPFGGASWMFSGQTTDFGFRRINGGAPEPSHWAPFSLMAIALLLASSRGRFSARRRALFGLAAFNLVFTLSGTALVGLVGVLAGYLLTRASALFSWKIRLGRTLLLAVGLPLLLGGALAAITRFEVLNAYFGEGLLRKLSGQNESGAVRLYIMVLTALAFAERPFYGVGVGTIASFNTFLTILGSGGILLFLPYLWLVAAGGYRVFRAYRIRPDAPNLGWFVLYWSMLFVTSFSYGEIFSFFSWLWIFFSYLRPMPAESATEARPC